MEKAWAADQLRRKQKMSCRPGLPDMPIRRVTSALPQVAVAAMQGGLASSTPPGDATVGTALSALAINAQSADQCRRICDGLQSFLSDREMARHAEFAELKGVEAVLGILRHQGGEAALSALRVVEKVSRTLPRELCAAGGVEILARCAEVPGQAPRLLEAALRCLHGLTFDREAKTMVARRGVFEIVQQCLESEPERRTHRVVAGSEEQEAAREEAWSDVIIMCNRVYQRLSDSKQRPGASTRR